MMRRDDRPGNYFLLALPAGTLTSLVSPPELTASSAIVFEDALLLESYPFVGSSVSVIGLCESPIEGTYFVADARTGGVLSFDALRRTTRSQPVIHAPKDMALLWFGSLGPTAARYGAYLRREDGSGLLLIFQPVCSNGYVECVLCVCLEPIVCAYTHGREYCRARGHVPPPPRFLEANAKSLIFTIGALPRFITFAYCPPLF